MTNLIDTTDAKFDTLNVIVNQSIPASGVVNSISYDGQAVKNVKVDWKVAGTTCVALLQGSMDNGTTWYTIQTLSAGINAIQPVQDLLLRVQVTNNNAGAQTNEVWATFQV